MKKVKNNLPLKKKALLHIDFFGFFDLIGINKNVSLEKYFFDYVEKNFCKKFMTPTFNYQYCKTLKTSIDAKSELNKTSEFFRKNLAKWRSIDPIFSFCGNYKKKIKFKNKLRSFDRNSAIQDIIDDDGYYFFCGTPISFLTPGIHYLENIINTRYRYDKIFSGTIKVKNRFKKIDYTYKVWPMYKKLNNNYQLSNANYDAKKINNDLIKAGVMKVFLKKSNRYIMYCKAKRFNNFLKKKIKNDELYPLDRNTKLWIKPLLKRLGRPFEKIDFEK